MTCPALSLWRAAARASIAILRVARARPSHTRHHHNARACLSPWHRHESNERPPAHGLAEKVAFEGPRAQVPANVAEELTLKEDGHAQQQQGHRRHGTAETLDRFAQLV